MISGGRGKNDNTHPDDYIVRVYIEKFDDQRLLSTASRLSQQLHTIASPSDDLGATATFDQQLRGQALDAVVENLSDSDRNALLDSSQNLQRELHLYSQGGSSRAQLAEAILATDKAFSAHGIPGVYRINEQGQVCLLYTSPSPRD